MKFIQFTHLMISDIFAVPTFVSFLRDIESPFEVKDYIRMYLGMNCICNREII